MVVSDWLAEHRGLDQRRFLSFLAASVALHVSFVGIVAFVPARSVSPVPDVIRVNFASLPSAAKPLRPVSPSPKPVAPRPRPKEIVLPRQAPAAVTKRPVPNKVVPLPRARERIDYEDALSQLRAELGEETPPAPLIESVEADAAALGASLSAEASSDGRAVDADAERWHRDVTRHLRSCWITPPEFLNRSLSSGLAVQLTSTGAVLGEPSVTNSSGDPFFDENAVRAVMRCAPLPTPPAAGQWRFAFTSDAR